MKLFNNANSGRCAHAFVLVLLCGVVSLLPLCGVCAQDAATSTSSTTSGEGGPTLLNKPFRLLGQTVIIKMAEETSEVETLYAETNVSLDMEGLSITGERLTYDAATQLLYTYRGDKDRVVVRQGNTIIFCDKLLYNAETGDIFPKGKPQWRIIQENGQIILINGEETSVKSDGISKELKITNGVLQTEGFVPEEERNARNKMMIEQEGVMVELNEETVGNKNSRAVRRPETNSARPAAAPNSSTLRVRPLNQTPPTTSKREPLASPD